MKQQEDHQKYSRVRELLLTVARARGEGDRAEDLVQDAMVVLWRRYQDLSSFEDLKRVALTILYLKRHAALRARRSWTDAASASLVCSRPGPERAALAREALDITLEAAETLPAIYREVIMRRAHEIPVKPGEIPVGTLYARSSRALVRLRSAIRIIESA